MSKIIETSTALRLFDCTQCGGFIALSENLERRLRESHETFYCPIGHHQYFPAKTDAEKLRDALHTADIEKSRLTKLAREAEAMANAAALRQAVAERQAARLKKRAVAGVCPCCNRTFKQLAAHMKNKHPEAV